MRNVDFRIRKIQVIGTHTHTLQCKDKTFVLVPFHFLSEDIISAKTTHIPFDSRHSKQDRRVASISTDELKAIMYLEHTTHHQNCSTVPLEVKQALFNGSRMTLCACCMLQKYLDVRYIQIFRNKCFRYARYASFDFSLGLLLHQWLIQA